MFDTSNRSIREISLHMSTISVGNRRRGQAESDSDDDEDDNEAEMESYISFQEEAYVARMRRIRDQFDRLIEFVRTGLRGVARAGGESAWEMLAEKLEQRIGD